MFLTVQTVQKAATVRNHPQQHVFDAIAHSAAVANTLAWALTTFDDGHSYTIAITASGMMFIHITAVLAALFASDRYPELPF